MGGVVTTRREWMQAHGGGDLADDRAAAAGLPRRVGPTKSSRVVAAGDRSRIVWLAEPVPLKAGGRVRVLGYDRVLGAPPGWLAAAGVKPLVPTEPEAVADRAREAKP